MLTIYRVCSNSSILTTDITNTIYIPKDYNLISFKPELPDHLRTSCSRVDVADPYICSLYARYIDRKKNWSSDPPFHLRRPSRDVGYVDHWS